MTYRQVFASFLILVSIEASAQQGFTSDSPSTKIQITVNVTAAVYFSVKMDNNEVMDKPSFALLTTSSKFGIQSKVRSTKRRSIRETIVNPVPFKRKEDCGKP